MQKAYTLFHVITDWLLIILGVLLIIVASRAIDVVVIRYGIIAVGALLSCSGLWFRFRRVRGKGKKL